MAKRLSFKDFMTVDYTPGEPEQVSWNAKKRHRGVVGESVDEELSFSQRRARGRMMKKIKAKLKIGRAKASRKMATLPTLQKRAQKHVRNNLFKKFSKGKSRGELPMARRAEIEKRIAKLPQTRIQNLVRKELPATRKAERDRKQHKGSSNKDSGK